VTVSLQNEMKIFIGPRNEILSHEYDRVYHDMNMLYNTIELVIKEVKRKHPDIIDTELLFETSNDETEKCIHDFEVVELDEIRNVVVFQCSKCRVLGNARVKIK